jgi:hypothetical protein
LCSFPGGSAIGTAKGGQRQCDDDVTRLVHRPSSVCKCILGLIDLDLNIGTVWHA